MTARGRGDVGINLETGNADDGEVNIVNERTSRAEIEDVTATVTAGARSVIHAPTLTEFMSAVVPWPGTLTDAGYVNLQYSYVDNKTNNGKRNGKWPVGAGWPFKSIDQFVSRAAWLNSTSTFKDAWYCLSLQSKAKPHPRKPGKLTAVRLARNAMAVKAIWVDIDVKPGQYDTLQDALKAIMQFRQGAGLPPFSALVSSGSGLHVYWISDVALSPTEWAPYAHGLKALLLQHGVKCDAGLTTDIARILRVPGTFNHKTDPPKPVQLLNVPLVCYDFPSQLGFLTQIAPIRAVPSGSTSRTLFADGADIAAFKLGSNDAFKDLPVDEKLAERSDEILLSIAPIFKQCGMYREALRTGGAGYGNELWMLSVLGTTFMENGNAVAHEISKGHATYSPADTQALYDRKVAERADRGIGYPSCAAIAGAGSSACASCPLFARGKSPLNIKPIVTATVTAQGASSESLPPGDGETAEWEDPLDFSEVPLAEAIARINAAGFFVLTLNGDTYRSTSDGGAVVQKREGFNTIFASRQASLAGGKSINAGAAWRASGARREYERIGFWPANYDLPPGAYNLWRGWGVDPREGDWSKIHDLIFNIIADADEAKANYVLDWLAHMVQRPWEKPGVALVLRGRKGTGKSLLVSIVVRLLGPANALTTADANSLFGTFNWHLADKLLICAEEAFFAGNRAQSDQLKHLLTGSEIEVEQKYGQRISMPSRHRMLMTSNHDQVVPASEDERRYFVLDVSDRRRRDDAYFAPLVRITNGGDEAALAAFMHELQTRDVNNWRAERDARRAAGADLARQKLLSLEPPLQWLLEQTSLSTTTLESEHDVGEPSPSDIDLESRPGSVASYEVPREQCKTDVLRQYRQWAKDTQVRGAREYVAAENFWRSLKRLLNREYFPDQRLFRASGGRRLVVWPPASELREGFNRLFGAAVDDEECSD